MDGRRLAAKGIAFALFGVALFLFGVLMMAGPVREAVFAGVVATASGGAIVGWTLRPQYVFGGGLIGAAGLLWIIAANLGLVPRDASAYFLGGIEVAAFGIGVLGGGWVRILRLGAARRKFGALSER
jgi:hypothetical protein